MGGAAMQFEFARIRSAGAAAFKSVFGGRIARATLALRAVILIGVIRVIFAPIGTILESSKEILREAVRGPVKAGERRSPKSVFTPCFPYSFHTNEI